MEKAAVLLNPSSGKGRSIKRKTEIERNFKRLGISYDLFISRSEEHLEALAEEKAGKYKILVAVGGDTTFNIVARKLLKRKEGQNPAVQIPKLGMIGTGSANDIVRALGVHKIPNACAAIKNGHTGRMDVGIADVTSDAGTQHLTFLGTVSAGMGTTVNRYVENFLHRHKLLRKIPLFNQFIPGLLGMNHSFFAKKLPIPARVIYRRSSSEPAREIDTYFSLLVLLNTPFYANGMKLGVDNGLFDGVLDGCIIDTSSFLKTVKVGLKAGKESFSKLPEVLNFQSPHIEIIPKSPLSIQVDGDIYKETTYIKITLEKGALEVFRSK